MRLAGLYPIVDVGLLRARGIAVRDFAARVLEARPALLQLLAKDIAARDTLELLRELLPLCRAAGTLLFGNDRPDLALLAGADGVHVGQSDLRVSDVRRFAPALKIGASTHDLAELESALAERPDYVAFGPVFPTKSKANPDPVVGLDGLRAARDRARRSGIALVAIGGIDHERAPAIAELGVPAAVIGALVPRSDDPTLAGELASELQRLLGVGNAPT